MFFKKFERDEKAEDGWVKERLFRMRDSNIDICRLRRTMLRNESNYK